MRAQVSYVSWSNSSGRGAREEAPPNKREVCDAGKSTPAVRRVSIFLSLVGTLIAFEEAVCERETLDRCAQWDLNLIQPPRIYQYKSGCAVSYAKNGGAYGTIFATCSCRHRQKYSVSCSSCEKRFSRQVVSDWLEPRLVVLSNSGVSR